MGWPLSQDYNEAIQSAATAFADPELKGCEAVAGPTGLPLPRSGNFADVYQYKGADGTTWAVKCFTRQVPGLQERYARIDQHLEEAGLPFTVGFEFQERGIRVRGTSYPILKMEWVEGFTLNEFVRQHADHPAYLRALLGLWVRLSKRLRDAGVAHADLQHGNVLLVPGAAANKLGLKLIDYDGMWVPALAKKPSGEAGHPAYQHPARLRDGTYSADVDRFPHLVIACALRATAVAGRRLWDRFDNGDNLLFREADLADPASSEVARALWDLDDPTVTNLLALLVLSSRRPLKDTPWLDEVLVGDQAVAVSDAILGRAADVLGVPRRGVRKAAPAAQVFVASDETNEFADIYENDDAPRPAPTRKAKGSKAPLVAAMGLAVVAAAVVFAVVVSQGGGKPPPDDPDTGAVVGPVEPPGVGPKPVDVPDPKLAAIETRWVKVQAGPAIAPGKPLVAEAVPKPPIGRVVGGADADVFAVAFLPDGTRAILAARERLDLVDLRPGGVVRAFAQEGGFMQFALSPDGAFAVTAGRDRQVRCWDVETGDQSWAMPFPGDVTALAVTPDGRRVVASAEGVGYVEWAAADGSEARRHAGLQATLLSFTPDGKRAVARVRGRVEVWDLDEGTSRSLDPAIAATDLALAPDGATVYAVAPGQPVQSWTVADGKPLADRPPVGQPGKRSAALTSAGAVVYVDGLSGRAILAAESDITSSGVTGPAAAIDFTPDFSYALVARPKSSVLLVRVQKEERAIVKKEPVPPKGKPFVLAHSLPLVGTQIYCLVSPTEKHFLIRYPTEVRVFDFATFKQVAVHPLEPDESRTRVSFGPDESLMVGDTSGGKPRTRTWDWMTNKYGPAFVVPGAEAVHNMKPVPDRPWVIGMVLKSGEIIFDVRTGKPLVGWPPAKTVMVHALTPSSDGKYIAYAVPLQGVHLWDCETRQAGPTLEGSVGVSALDFTPDAKKLVGVWPFGRIRIWDVNTGNLESEVDHDLRDSFFACRMLSDNLALIRGGLANVLLRLDTGKQLDIAEYPGLSDPGGSEAPRRSMVVAFVAKGPLNVWKYDSPAVEALPVALPTPNRTPDVLRVRDGPWPMCVGAAYVNDGDKIVVAAANGKVYRYTADRLAYDGEFNADETTLKSMVLGAKRLFTLGQKSGVRVWDADKMTRIAEFGQPAKSEPTFLAAKPDGRAFFIGNDKSMRLVTLPKGQETLVVPPARAGGRPLTQFAYAEDASIGVARWGNNIIGVWKPRDGAEGKILFSTGAEPAPANAFALTPDGKTALLLTYGGRIKSWDVASGKGNSSDVVHRDGGPNTYPDLKILSGGTHFLTAGNDAKVILWQVAGVKKVKEYTVGPGPKRLCVAPNEQSFLLVRSGAIELLKLPDLTEVNP